jgi:UDP-glucose 4-epimerase
VRSIAHPQLAMVSGGVEDAAAVAVTTHGIEAIIHLAWSFSDNPLHLVEHDLRGHALLLGAARDQSVRQFVYASTAVVYGKPLRTPIDEDHPLRVLEARKPAYRVAKECAEKLTLLAGRETGLTATILRFWWAFGVEIGGRHLRDMLRTAADGKPLAVPADCGGSFLSQEDFNRAIDTLLSSRVQGGQIFNLASAYVDWGEIARMVMDVTAGQGGIEMVPREAWAGAAFLADRWELDDRRIRKQLGFTPCREASAVRDALRQAITATWRKLQAKES